ncbi:MAG: CorA family divalent cation transporter [Syntrophomonadaceae bacterium]|nr:CorA family divalent cation transporter [Syntrophomonadaceae bacterium]
MNVDKLNQAKSLHIFMFPFTWEGKDDVKSDIGKEWRKENDNTGAWVYNQNAYFYANVNQAINDSDIVSNWKYKFQDDHNIYAIKIQARDNPYELNVEEIRLKLYNTGIGILSFHLINNEYDQEEDILRINDYGRRIFPPFLPLKSSVMAESITLQIGQACFSENYKPDDDYLEKPPRISNIIMSLLGNTFTYDPKESQDKVLIKPVIDDRMFVVCWWNNNARSRFLKKYKTIMNDGDFWHKFFFIDSGYSGCQSQNMLKDLLRNHTYERWLNYGTMYGITRYSLMLLTDDSDDICYLRLHMWTIYYQMACLALAQRASILKFSQQISEIVSIKKEKIDSQKVQKLHYEYLRFINQLYFREVNAQEQGIEMYDMLVSSMYIERDVKRLDEEIGELYQHIRLEEDKKALDEDRKTNETLYLLTVLGALFVFPNLLTSFFGMNVFSKPLLQSLTRIDTLFLVMLFIVPIVLALLFLVNKIKFKKDILIYWAFIVILIVYLIAGIFCFIFGKGWLCG